MERKKNAIYFSSTFQVFIKARHTLFLYKQPVYKQLALGWKIAKQLSGLNPLSLNYNKNIRLAKRGIK